MSISVRLVGVQRQSFMPESQLSVILLLLFLLDTHSTSNCCSELPQVLLGFISKSQTSTESNLEGSFSTMVRFGELHPLRGKFGSTSLVQLNTPTPLRVIESRNIIRVNKDVKSYVQIKQSLQKDWKFRTEMWWKMAESNVFDKELGILTWQSCLPEIRECGTKMRKHVSQGSCSRETDDGLL